MSPGVKIISPPYASTSRLLFRGARVQAAPGVFVALGEIVGLNDRDVLHRCRIGVDDHIVHHLKRRQIEGAQVLRHERTEICLHDVFVGCEAGDQNVGFGFGIEQMADVTRDARCRRSHGT